MSVHLFTPRISSGDKARNEVDGEKSDWRREKSKVEKQESKEKVLRDGEDLERCRDKRLACGLVSG